MTTYPLPLPSLLVTINGEDRTAYIERRSLVVDQLNGAQVDTANFQLKQPETYRAPIASIKPTVGQLVIISTKVVGDTGWTRLFGGTVLRVGEPRIAYRTVAWDVQCVDFSQYLRRRLVQEQYTDMTVTDIVRAMVMRYAPQIRLTEVQTSGRIVNSFTANYRYAADCLDELAGMIGWDWYVDPYSALHFYDPLSADRQSALSLTDTSANFHNLAVEPQLDQVRNRVFVQGANAYSDPITERWVLSGLDNDFPIQLQNRDLSLEPDDTGLITRSVRLNGVWQSAALQGADQSIARFLIDTANGVVIHSSEYARPNDLDVLEFVYKYRYPLNVVVEDLESQAILAALALQYDTIILNVDDAEPATPPVGYWRLDEKAAGSAVDSSGNGRNGVYDNFGPLDFGQPGALVGDPDATGVIFDGQPTDSPPGNNYLHVDHDPALNLGGDATGDTPWAINLWVRQDYRNQTTARMLLNKGLDDGPPPTEDALSVRLHLHGRGIVSLTSTTATAALGVADLSTGPTNNCQIQLPDDQWHMVTFTYGPLVTEGLAGYLDGERVFRHVDAVAMNNAAMTGDLYLGSRTTTLQNLLGQLSLVTLWNGVVVTPEAVRRIYVAAQEDGVREVRIAAGESQRASEARALGQIELAKWSRVITRITWLSYVHGWRIGDTVTITLTESGDQTQPGSGRTFSGTARIQRLTASLQGAQRILWAVECEASRFNLIDYYRQLTRTAQVLTGSEQAVIPKTAAIESRYQAIVIDGPVAITQLGLLQYVAPDALAGGSTPYAKVEFSIVQQNVYG